MKERTDGNLKQIRKKEEEVKSTNAIKNCREANVIETMSYYSTGDTVSGRCSSYRVPKATDGGKVCQCFQFQ